MDERPPQRHVITVGNATFIVVAEGEEAERLAAGQAAKAVVLRAALLNLMGDNHHYSKRPCSTCSQCRRALGIEIDEATGAGMLGCGFSMTANLAAWRLAIEGSA